MMKPNIYLVDDNKDLQDTISENLVEDGYDVTQAFTAAELFTQLKTIKADTILLDLMLPDANGLNLIAKIRECTDAPIIVVSGKGQMVDKVVGLEMGADDYLGKPFEIRELLARVKAHVRRYRTKETSDKVAPASQNDLIKFGKWILDRQKLQIFDGQGASGDLTVKEFRLLEALVLSPNRVLSREQLLKKSREDFDVFDRTVDIQIARIRKKIGDDATFSAVIKTVRGAGYMFVSDKGQ